MTVKGYIYDTDGNPINGASVFSVTDETKGDATNANGYFQFDITFPTKLKVKMLGFHDLEIDPSTTAIGYQLEPNGLEIEEVGVNATVSKKSSYGWLWVVAILAVGAIAYDKYSEPKAKKVKI